MPSPHSDRPSQKETVVVGYPDGFGHTLSLTETRARGDNPQPKVTTTRDFVYTVFPLSRGLKTTGYESHTDLKSRSQNATLGTRTRQGDTRGAHDPCPKELTSK